MSIHILQFFASLDNGGAENRMMDVYSHIDSSVINFDFAVLENKNHYLDEKVKEKNSRKIVFPNPKYGIISNYKALNSFFKNNKGIYQAIHTHVSWYSGIVLFSAKKAGIPNRIAHSRGSGRKSGSITKKLFSAIGKLLIRISATECLAISEEAGEFLYGKNAVKCGKCKVIPNSVDETKYYVLSDEERQQIRLEFVSDINTKLFVTVANLRKIKNHSFLLDIAYELKKRNYPFKLCLIGEGDQRELIEKKITVLKLSENVILLGNRSDVPEILGAFDGMIFNQINGG